MAARRTDPAISRTAHRNEVFVRAASALLTDTALPPEYAAAVEHIRDWGRTVSSTLEDNFSGYMRQVGDRTQSHAPAARNLMEQHAITNAADHIASEAGQ